MLLLPAHDQKTKLLSMVTLFQKYSSTRIGRQRSPDREASHLTAIDDPTTLGRASARFVHC